MSRTDYTTLKSLTLIEIKSNKKYKELLRQYALEFCSGPVQVAFLKLSMGK